MVHGLRNYQSIAGKAGLRVAGKYCCWAVNIMASKGPTIAAERKRYAALLVAFAASNACVDNAECQSIYFSI